MFSSGTYLLLYALVLVIVAAGFYRIFKSLAHRMPREINENRLLAACIASGLMASPLVTCVAHFTGLLAGRL